MNGMTNEQKSIADTVREQLDNVTVSIVNNPTTGYPAIEVNPNDVGIPELISRYHDAWQENLMERQSARFVLDDREDDKQVDNEYDFNPNDSGPISTSAVAGKTIKDVVIDNERMDDYLVFNFTDGTSLRIRYDYIYEWSLAASK